MLDSILRAAKIVIPSIILVIASLTILQSIAPRLASYQLIFAIVGLLIAVAISRIDLDIFSGSPWIWYALGVIPLALTELFGVVSRGSTRWLVIGGQQFQTSEFAKFTLIMFAAIWLSKHTMTDFKNSTKFLAYMGVPILLVFIQPDLGSALMLASIALVGIVVAGVPLKHLLALVLCSIIAIPVGLQFLKPYQRDRLTTFFSPQNDPLGKGYNATQATIAVGAGRLFGRGLGQGTQSHLRFLPERHTDFIFASFVEELGFVGGLILIGTYIWLSVNLIHLAALTSASYQSIVILITAGMLFVQTTINIGMNMGILPITGVTLPLFSYGGSSLLSTWMILGLSINFAFKAKSAKKTFEIA